MEEAVHLLVNRADYGGMSMSHIEAADATGKIDERIAVDIFDECAFGLGDVDGRGVREAAGNGLRAAAVEFLRARARDCGA